MVEHAVEHEGRIAVGALDRAAAERGRGKRAGRRGLRHRVAVDEELFVVRIGEALVVKRFRQVGGRWSLVSDSLAHLPRPMTADDGIVGRVAWCGPPGAAVA